VVPLLGAGHIPARTCRSAPQAHGVGLLCLSQRVVGHHQTDHAPRLGGLLLYRLQGFLGLAFQQQQNAEAIVREVAPRTQVHRGADGGDSLVQPAGYPVGKACRRGKAETLEHAKRARLPHSRGGTCTHFDTVDFTTKVSISLFQARWRANLEDHERDKLRNLGLIAVSSFHALRHR